MLKIFSQIVWKGAWIGTMMLLFCTSLAARQKQEITFELIGITENQPVGSLVAILHEEASKEGTFWRLADDHLDNQAFRIQNDSVFSAISFDFETDSLYHLVVELWQIGGVLDLVSIPVIIGDLRGKFDQNGVADDEVAAFYPGVNVGDYLFLQPNVGKDNLYYGNGIPAIHYPNRIYLKAAVYDVILINLESVEGISGDQPVIITNFLGQVQARKVLLQGGSNWRFSGQYDPGLDIGFVRYPGCEKNGSKVDFGWSSGSFGIWIRNGFSSDEVGLTVYGDATRFEIDHIEVSDGGFAGIMAKSENGTKDMDDVYIHHTYIHDVDGEGLYLGSTGHDPQHQLNRLRVEHNVILRTGAEAVQAGQLGDHCEIRHNVLWGGMSWTAPFAMHQDHTLQIMARKGSVECANNILLGAGNAFINFLMKPLPGVIQSSDSIIFRNNLCWQARGPLGAYMGEETDGQTTVVWRENFFGSFHYDYDRVYTARPESEHIVRIASDSISVVFWDNVIDQTKSLLYKRWSGSTATIVDLGFEQAEIAEPQFLDLIGEGASFLAWQNWTDIIGPSSGFLSKNTRKGDSLTYQPGDVVKFPHGRSTRYYQCLQSNLGRPPSPEGDPFWALLTWKNEDGISYIPPDDVRLDSSSLYFLTGIGLELALPGHGGAVLSDEEPEPSGFQVFPNPTQGRIQVVPASAEPGSVLIFSATGQQVASHPLRNGRAELSLEGLSNGLYLVAVQQGERRQMERIMLE